MEHSMSTSDNKRTVEAMLMSGQFLDPSALTEDFVFYLHADPTCHPAAELRQPIDRVLQGWERAKDFFQHRDGSADGLEVVVRNILGEGDQVVVEFETHAVTKAEPARVLDNRLVAIFEFRDGKAYEMRNYEDTAHVRRFFEEQNDSIIRTALLDRGAG
jgi:ketosteroid isomerase-like protein